MNPTVTRRTICPWLCVIAVLSTMAISQEKTETKAPGNYALLSAGDSMEEIVRKAANVVPSPRQLAWQ